MPALVWSSLYDAVAVGMYAYTRSSFRLRIIAGEDERIEEDTLYLAAHRAETDVPAICGAYYFIARVWRQAAPRLHFAARDDLFEPGFFAGFPPGQPRIARRALHGISIGGHLPRVHVHPISSANSMKLVQALAMIDPATPLVAALPAPLHEPVRARAVELGNDELRFVSDVRHPDYIDVLWQNVGVDDLPAELFAEAWARRAATATSDLRTIVDLVKDGEALLLFPEGRPSVDGTLGPLQRGMGAILRRGRPSQLRAFGLAYDPLTVRRSSVVLTVAEAIETPAGGGEPELLPFLARAIAVTTGQVVAATLRRSVEAGIGELAPADFDAALLETLSEAARMRRVVDPLLLEHGSRRDALDDALRAVERRGLVAIRGPRRIELLGESIARDAMIERLANEHDSVTAESARASV